MGEAGGETGVRKARRSLQRFLGNLRVVADTSRSAAVMWF